MMELKVLFQSLAINYRKTLTSTSAGDIVALEEVLACLNVLKTENQDAEFAPSPSA